MSIPYQRKKWSRYFITFNPNKRFKHGSPEADAMKGRLERAFDSVFGSKERAIEFIVFLKQGEGKEKIASLSVERVVEHGEINDCVHLHALISIAHFTKIRLNYVSVKSAVVASLGLHDIHMYAHVFNDATSTFREYMSKRVINIEKEDNRLVRSDLLMSTARRKEMKSPQSDSSEPVSTQAPISEPTPASIRASPSMQESSASHVDALEEFDIGETKQVQPAPKQPMRETKNETEPSLPAFDLGVPLIEGIDRPIQSQPIKKLALEELIGDDDDDDDENGQDVVIASIKKNTGFCDGIKKDMSLRTSTTDLPAIRRRKAMPEMDHGSEKKSAMRRSDPIPMRNGKTAPIPRKTVSLPPVQPDDSKEENEDPVEQNQVDPRDMSESESSSSESDDAFFVRRTTRRPKRAEQCKRATKRPSTGSRQSTVFEW